MSALATPEPDARAMARWVEACAAQGISRGAALDELARRSARARGVELREARQGGETLDLFAAHEARAVAGLPALPDEVLRDPHVLGWFHQHAQHPARRVAFAAHVHGEAKHDDTMTSTQIFTPRWVADALVAQTVGALARERVSSSDAPPTICDPAMGGGQMLLAALDGLLAWFPALDAPGVAALLHGVELDPEAVAVARRGVMLRLEERLGPLDAATRAQTLATITAQLRQGDALVCGLDAAPFDVVLTNPPYMGRRSMPRDLIKRLDALASEDTTWRAFGMDLGAAFTWLCVTMSREFVGLLAQQNLWFLRRFEAARAHMQDACGLTWFAHLGAGVFDGLSGEKASVVASTHRRGHDGAACFVDARALRDAHARRALIAASLCGEAGVWHEVRAFAEIPGAPLAHDLASGLRAWFRRAPRTLGDVADIPGSQNKTGANRRYVCVWDEVPREALHATTGLWALPGAARPGRWRFYSKGGGHAPWWGGWRSVVDWSSEARAFYRENRTSNLLDAAYWDREGLCYTDFGGRRFNARWLPAGCVFDMAGPAIFLRERGTTDEERARLLTLLALLNAAPARALLNAMNPTLHYQVRDLRNLPWPDRAAATDDALAAAARTLIGAVRAAHALVPGDPLHDDAASEPARCAALLAGLHDAQEALVEIERRAAEVFRVTPPETVTLRHHALERAGVLPLP